MEPRKLTAVIVLAAAALASPTDARRRHTRFATRGEKQARGRGMLLCLALVFSGRLGGVAVALLLVVKSVSAPGGRVGALYSVTRCWRKAWSMWPSVKLW
jgi:hypothetical protein